MSIDAIISSVEPHEEGALLRLRDPAPGRIAGQGALVVVNPPACGLDAVVGMHIWGGSDFIMMGHTKWADRIGYARIRLKAKQTEATQPPMRAGGGG